MANPPVAPAPIRIPFKDVVEAMIKKQGLTEGIWALYIEFGIGAANIPGPDGILKPTALIPIISMGLHPAPTISDIAVDAASIVHEHTEKAPIKGKKKSSRDVHVS